MPLFRFLLVGTLFSFSFLSQNLQAEQSPATVTVPAQTLAALEGSYASANDPDTPLSLYVKDGALMLESERLVPVALSPQSATVFALPGGKQTIHFTLEENGRAASLVFSDEPKTAFLRTGAPARHSFYNYVRTEAMIPMRDGVKLHVVILKPAEITAPLPFLIQRTPYGVDQTTGAWFYRARPELAHAGYIYVGADIRGRFKSEGQFVMMRPLADHRDPKAIDESTDAYDTVDWLIKNIAGNNGRAGFVGTSYPGFLSMMAGIDPHLAVKAISPQAPMIDTWLGDDFFHNGAFRQTYGYDYVFMLESSKEETAVDYGKDAAGKPMDGYDFFLKRGSFREDVRRSGAKTTLPTWKIFLEHPGYDALWQARGVERALTRVAVPTLSVGGTYDQEDMYGPQREYARLEAHDTRHENFLVLGPWRHGFWSSSARHLGNVAYGAPIGTEFRTQIEAKFFARYLKDEPGFDLEDTASFQTGSNTWQRYASFPPKTAHETSLYLDAKGALGWTAPAAAARTRYTSDPANPVPYRARPIQPTYGEGSQWYNWLTEDQRFLAGRNDVATWALPVLDHDLTLTGEVVADLFAATTGSDADLVVKLIDESPADDADPSLRGYQLMTNAEIFRGRYRSGFDKPAPLSPDAPAEFRFSLHDVDHVFKAGHRVLVQVQSSWFPLYDRNPQRFVKNIMTARPKDYQPATITVYEGADHASRLLLPVVSR